MVVRQGDYDTLSNKGYLLLEMNEKSQGGIIVSVVILFVYFSLTNTIITDCVSQQGFKFLKRAGDYKFCHKCE